MKLLRTARELRATLPAYPERVFVPTMGALHEGHLHLVKRARSLGGATVVSIFVNRLQFGLNEDFDRYPRTLAEDCAKLESVGCDLVFAPDEREVYPEPQTFTIDPGPIGTILEGAARPGHFRGVATVVTKLFNLVQPKIAVFGKKDYQQCRVIEAMVRQLALPVEIILAETVRAEDGLALSSRNKYFSAEERAEAPRLYRVLKRVAEAVACGRAIEAEETAAQQELASHGWRTDYVTVRRRCDLAPPGPEDRELVVLGAARLGSTRLIDNLEFVRG
ncbi:MAG: pantoate--beta-alanine ligase [Casimicrobiaceae bacterium]|nr:pantoate--beta-alanine ligase [Casimicrobiaceae bacterium]